MRKEKVLIAFADDLPRERERITKAIDDLPNYKITVAATSGRDLILQLAQAKYLPQIILMDMQMPCCDGLLATIICKRLFPTIKIVGLSSHTSIAVISEFIAEGGNAFFSKYLLVKDSISYKAYNQDNVFANFLQQVIDNNTLFLDPLLEYNNKKHKNIITTTQAIKAEFPKLKDYEITYLQLNAAGFTKPQIKIIMNREVATIKKYFEKISKKFGAENHTDLINICSNHGIIKMVNLFQKQELNTF